MYLKGTQEYCIHCTKDCTRLGLRDQKLNTLYALMDSQTDFAGCCDTARSTSGNVILVNNCVTGVPYQNQYNKGKLVLEKRDTADLSSD